MVAEALRGGDHDVILPQLRGRHLLGLAVEDLDADRERGQRGVRVMDGAGALRKETLFEIF